MNPVPHLSDILTWADLYLTPLYILLAYFIVKHFQKKYYANTEFRKYIIPALMLRIGGCIFLTLLMQFYYHDGDTFSYFTGAHEIWQAFVKHPGVAFEMILNNPSNYSAEASEYAQHMGNSLVSAHIAMFKISGVVGLLCFGQYLPIAIMFTLLSFFGSWLIFLVFVKKYPHLWKRLAITTLFIPSTIVWSTAILKEPLCMFGIGLCFYSLTNFLNRNISTRNVVFFLLGSWILFTIKDYLFYTFLAAAAVSAYFTFINNLRPLFLKYFIKLVMYVSIISVIIYFFNEPNNLIINEFGRYFTRADNLQNFMIQTSNEYGGAAYTLPTSDFSSMGILKSFFLSLNVSLFRPYLWECNNALMIFNFLESFVTSVLVILVLFKLLLGKIKIRNNPLFIFCLVFTLLLAFMVGYISFNFGTLIRYKVPFQPFFYSALVILLSGRQKKTIALMKQEGLQMSSHTAKQ